MAVWHFKFALVPKEVIVSVCGGMVKRLPEYSGEGRGDEVLDGFPNYWLGGKSIELLLDRASRLLPEIESWTSEARMFGCKDGDRIEVWEDDVLCYLDLRKLSLSLLEGIIYLAASSDCSLVLFGSGEVVEPELPLVVEKIKESNAFAFCVDPASFFAGL
ncbi:hypothetical protein GV819_04495 [Pseudomonas sp. Fl5BN2]|uniref:hypothetical protein n=1 Tax=Pseudomonas sp. Fl5BN2 TaxID=2697652 RepID=UPI001377350B|nr:hypothetical protein [Pseudomonas sp. Fl5BN2]NBF01544.1 hypothetical protein [Pseudomonas sp. Fl5BN2]